MIWTTKQLENALGVSVTNNRNFEKVEFNSADINQGDLFIALKGGARDGHMFVQDALNRGAAAAIVSDNIANVNSDKLIIVDDTFQALLDMAEYKRRNSSAKFIAVTGSVGKTSTKEAIKLMLSAYGKTFTNRGTFNNYIGVPLSLASMPNDCQYVVLEMGMNKKGELSSLSNLVVPNIAVVTTISEGHIEFFNSIREIADAKCEIFNGIDINDGIAIINRDMPVYERCVKNIDRDGIQNLQTFGRRIDSDTRFISRKILDNGDFELRYNIGNEVIEVIIPPLPPYFADNFAAAFAVIKALGLELNLAINAICSFVPSIGRGKMVQIQGDKKYDIICDYYNSNPQSLIASLKYLGELKNNNKIAILGDMKELGKFEIELHKSVVPHIEAAGVRKIFLVGDAMEKIKDQFSTRLEVYCFPDAELLSKKMQTYLSGGELILIKGSRSMKLEKVAKTLGVKDDF